MNASQGGAPSRARRASRAATSAETWHSRLMVSWAPVARLALMRSAIALRIPARRVRLATGRRPAAGAGLLVRTTIASAFALAGAAAAGAVAGRGADVGCTAGA